MMDLFGSHTPRMRYVLALIVPGLIALWLSVIIDPAWLPIATGSIFIALGLYEAVLLGKAAHDVTLDTYARLVEQYARMTPEQWHAAGLARIPLTRTVWQGLELSFWGDTQATPEQFSEFIALSNKQTTCSSRMWKDNTKHPRFYWEEITGWLKRKGFVDPNRQLQNESFYWLPGKWSEIQAARPSVKTYPRLSENDERINILQAETNSPSVSFPMEER